MLPAAHLPKMLNSDVLLLESVVVGHFPELDEVDGGAATDQLLHLLRPEHDQGVGRAYGVKAEVESSGITSTAFNPRCNYLLLTNRDS